MFPYRKALLPGTGVKPADAPEENSHLLLLNGKGIDNRVAMIFGVAAISLTETETKQAIENVVRACPGGNFECLLRHIADEIWRDTVYDGDEGATMDLGSQTDVYRSFKRVKTTHFFDCDCASSASTAIGSGLDLDAGVRVIEQNGPDGFAWTHIFGRLKPKGTPKWTSLELTPVPPLGDKAVPGWETPRATYRRHLDYIFVPSVWAAWLAKCDLVKGILAPLPKITASPTSCLHKDGPCNGKCDCGR